MKKSFAYLLVALFLGCSAAVIAAESSLEKQTPEQLESLESRAAAGNEKAQMKLAIMYLEGNGVSADTDKALFYYRLAAERDIAFAQHRLARLYLDNDHVEPDPAKALAWLLRAAKLGLVQAQLDLSQLYEDGTGINRDFVKAYKWLSIASSLTDRNLEPRQVELEAKMTFTELAQANLLSRICILTAYQDC